MLSIESMRKNVMASEQRLETLKTHAEKKLQESLVISYAYECL